jgi:hypothetical protein
LKHRIVDHLKSVHGKDVEIARVLSLTGKKRKDELFRLKNRGSYLHNVSVLEEGKGQFLCARRSHNLRHPSQYLPCIHCLGFYFVKDLWKHSKFCPLKDPSAKDKSHGVTVQARMLLEGSLDKEKDGNLKLPNFSPILLKMRDDPITQEVKNDNLILLFGESLAKKLGMKKKDTIVTRVRQLGRLRQQLGQPFENTISNKKYEEVIKAVDILCSKSCSDDGMPIYDIPSLALRLGHNLKKLAQIARGKALRQDNNAKYQEAEKFLKCFEGDWQDSVSSIALASLNSNKFNKPQLLPVTEDLKRLKNYLDEEMKKLIAQIKESVTATSYRALAEVALGKILMFNFRRSAEASQLTVLRFQERG